MQTGQKDSSRLMRVYPVLSLLFLALVMASPIVSAQSTQELFEPTQQILDMIIGLFNLSFLQNDATRYAAFARAMVFIIVFVIVQQVLQGMMNMSPNSAKVIALAVSGMSVVFLPSSMLIGLGETYAAFFMTLHILAIAYFSYIIGRRAETDHVAGKAQLILINSIMMFLYFYVITRMLADPNYGAVGGSVKTFVALITIVAGFFIFMNFARLGSGGGFGGGGNDISLFEDKNRDRRKKWEARGVKVADKSRALMQKARGSADVLRKMGTAAKEKAGFMIKAEQVELAEIGQIIAELTTALNAARAARQKRGANVAARQRIEATYKGQVQLARQHAARLEKILGVQQKVAKQQTKLRGRETALLKEEKHDLQGAMKAMKEKRSKLKSILKDAKEGKAPISPQMVTKMSALKKEAKQLIKKAEESIQNYEKVMKQERDVFKHVRKELEKISHELKEGKKLLKGATVEDLQKALPHFTKIRLLHSRLSKEEQKEMMYDRQKEQMALMQEQADEMARQIAVRIEKAMAQIASADQ